MKLYINTYKSGIQDSTTFGKSNKRDSTPKRRKGAGAGTQRGPNHSE